MKLEQNPVSVCSFFAVGNPSFLFWVLSRSFGEKAAQRNLGQKAWVCGFVAGLIVLFVYAPFVVLQVALTAHF